MAYVEKASAKFRRGGVITAVTVSLVKNVVFESWMSGNAGADPGPMGHSPYLSLTGRRVNFQCESG